MGGKKRERNSLRGTRREVFLTAIADGPDDMSTRHRRAEMR